MKKDEKLKRALYREFLLEKELYREAGLEKLPKALAEVLGCTEKEAIARALEGNFIEAAENFESLRRLMQIRDMVLLSKTPATLAAELKDKSISYDQCCRLALCYAVADRIPHSFAALRASAAKNESWARHHYLYGLLLAIDGDAKRACWELEMALEREPYDDGRIRVGRLLDILDAPNPS